MRRLLTQVLACVGLAVVMSCGTSAPQGPQNLVFVVIDTLRWDHLQSYGYRKDPTSPKLLSFADRAVVFDRAYSHAPWTKPSVASMLTSLLPREHGIFEWTQPLDPNLLTLTKHLDEHGFHTQAHISHHAFRPKDTNFNLGFDVYDSSVLKKGSPHEVTSSEEVTEGALAFLSDSPKERFFLWLHYFDPHIDYVKHADFDFGSNDGDRYNSEIAFVDHHLGRVFEALESEGRLEDTVVVVVADHGEGLGDHGIPKHTKALYEHQIHIPMIVYVPGVRPARQAEVVPAVDLAPTMLTLLDVPVPSAFGGKSIPYADGAFAPHSDRVVYAETRRFADLRAVVSGQHKLIRDVKTGQDRLFDLEADPKEKKNLGASGDEQRLALSTLLEKYTGADQRKLDEEPLAPDMEAALQALGYLEDDAK